MSESLQTDLDSQDDEIEALKSIYGVDFTQHDDRTIDVRICCDDVKWWAVTISVLLPPYYPSKDPPFVEIHTECLSGDELDNIHKQLQQLWNDNQGLNILYLWIEKIREMLFERYERAKEFIKSPEEDKLRESKKFFRNLLSD